MILRCPKRADEAADAMPGDFVTRRAPGSRDVGLIEEVGADAHAWVSWGPADREYLPLAALRRVEPGGHALDAREA